MLERKIAPQKLLIIQICTAVVLQVVFVDQGIMMAAGNKRRQQDGGDPV